MKRIHSMIGLAVLLAVFAGCKSGGSDVDASVVIDAGAPDGPIYPDDGGQCPSGYKSCGGLCASIDDPLFGCTATSCTPCSIAHGTATCVAGACAVGTCATGFGDCDSSGANGCETNLTTAHDHCHSCSTACSSSQVCSVGVCAGSCSSPLTNCSGACVNVDTDPMNCSTCGMTCPGATNGSATCAAMKCGVACNTDFHACSGQCVSDTDVNTCGTACAPCAPPANGSATCDGTSCGFKCMAGYVASGAKCVKSGGTSAFIYGWDFTTAAPDSSGVDPGSAANAKSVMATFAGSMMDLSLYGFGSTTDPQPTQGGGYVWTAQDTRVAMIVTAGGVPVMSLVGCPPWMQEGYPGIPTAIVNATGGAITAGTYRIRISSVVGGVESNASNESLDIVTTGSTSELTISWTPPTTVTPSSYNLYFGPAGKELLVRTGISAATYPAAPYVYTGANNGSLALVGAYPSSAFFDPPDPTHFGDFATLCAAAAAHFPQISYFVVWNELKGFFNKPANTLDGPAYTAMYNTVYPAIKKARPDAKVGGPYAVVASQPTSSATDAAMGLGLTPQAHNGNPATPGLWGWVDQRPLTAIEYWISNYVGADFIAVDGATVIANADNSNGDPSVTDPVTSSTKYYDIGRWLTAQMVASGRGVLPIWWMESHISAGDAITMVVTGANTQITCPAHGRAPGDTVYISDVGGVSGIDGLQTVTKVIDVDNYNISAATTGTYVANTGWATKTKPWTPAQQCAARVATLMLMEAGGTSVGIHWQPETQPTWPDIGLWTSSTIPNGGGGAPTLLATTLPDVLTVLRQPLTLVDGQPTGVIVGTSAAGTVLVNTTNAAVTAAYNGGTPLSAGQVLVR